MIIYDMIGQCSCEDVFHTESEKFFYLFRWLPLMKYDLFSFIFIIKCQVDHKLGENKAENETHAEVLRS